MLNFKRIFFFLSWACWKCPFAESCIGPGKPFFTLKFDFTGPWFLQCRTFSTGANIIFEFFDTGAWIISSFYWSFSNWKYETMGEIEYGTKSYFRWRFWRGHGSFLTKEHWIIHFLDCWNQRGHTKYLTPVTAHLTVPYSHKYWNITSHIHYFINYFLWITQNYTELHWFFHFESHVINQKIKYSNIYLASLVLSGNVWRLKQLSGTWPVSRMPFLRTLSRTWLLSGPPLSRTPCRAALLLRLGGGKVQFWRYVLIGCSPNVPARVPKNIYGLMAETF